MIAASSALSFLVCFAMVRVLLSRFRSFALDEPNARSLHVTPVPRTGGLAMIAGTASAVGLIGVELWLPMSLALALAAVSLYDDVRGLPGGRGLGGRVGGGAGVVWWVLSPMSPLELLLLVLAVVW